MKAGVIAYGNNGVFIYPCLFFGGEQLRHGLSWASVITDGRFQRREIAVVPARPLRDQQHMPPANRMNMTSMVPRKPKYA